MGRHTVTRSLSVIFCAFSSRRFADVQRSIVIAHFFAATAAFFGWLKNYIIAVKVRVSNGFAAPGSMNCARHTGVHRAVCCFDAYSNPVCSSAARMSARKPITFTRCVRFTALITTTTPNASDARNNLITAKLTQLFSNNRAVRWVSTRFQGFRCRSRRHAVISGSSSANRFLTGIGSLR
jgi:hypothetical protein